MALGLLLVVVVLWNGGEHYSCMATLSFGLRSHRPGPTDRSRNPRPDEKLANVEREGAIWSSRERDERRRRRSPLAEKEGWDLSGRRGETDSGGGEEGEGEEENEVEELEGEEEGPIVASLDGVGGRGLELGEEGIVEKGTGEGKTKVRVMR
ncbi:hypothetical protein CRG98_019374 [Punica granatum]|uniref:Uncharacterized protein n=1 Tax=Punica granatum TaxID=22663 RepID=A0A2I0JXJ7_PUNGR|nr:hypothetical protein CRG98_019374 [Punica granatum]